MANGVALKIERSIEAYVRSTTDPRPEIIRRVGIYLRSVQKQNIIAGYSVLPSSLSLTFTIHFTLIKKSSGTHTCTFHCNPPTLKVRKPMQVKTRKPLIGKPLKDLEPIDMPGNSTDSPEDAWDRAMKGLV